MVRNAASEPTATYPALKSAHISLAITPHLNDCAPLIESANTFLQFQLADSLSPAEQLSVLRNKRRSSTRTLPLYSNKTVNNCKLITNNGVTSPAHYLQTMIPN
ncbi:unnamed protein product [Anisakis simplex]|uniref:Uncharacterized protein n=1 Tax=Anisakis simplex TaxID=6269 RepID=A0A0M3J736_ANISI|nr:unnamed protein product [Anisakis simplex]